MPVGQVGPQAAARLRRDIEATWSDVAKVYVRDLNGAYNIVAKSDLKCSVETLVRQRDYAPTIIDRGELATLRNFKFEHDYLMPENAQIEVQGRRWNMRKDSLDLRRARPGSEPLYWIVDIVRIP